MDQPTTTITTTLAQLTTTQNKLSRMRAMQRMVSSEKPKNFENFRNFPFQKAENFTSSLLSAFGIATQSPPASNNQSRNNTNTTTTNTTASAGSQSTNQEGQLPRSRISQLFVPISMNRSRRVIFRRSSGRCSDRPKQTFSQIKIC